AICDAARRGVSIEATTVYITHFPCTHCAKMLAAAGVQTVKYHFDYKNDALVRELFVESHVDLEQL
ncbi:MAG: deaminase, partial [Opitutales bacterium]|nr:deaminase [Opitutales bacterium]